MFSFASCEVLTVVCVVIVVVISSVIVCVIAVVVTSAQRSLPAFDARRLFSGRHVQTIELFHPTTSTQRLANGRVRPLNRKHFLSLQQTKQTVTSLLLNMVEK